MYAHINRHTKKKLLCKPVLFLFSAIAFLALGTGNETSINDNYVFCR